MAKITDGMRVTVKGPTSTQSTGYTPGVGYTYGFVYPGDRGTVSTTDAAFVRYHACNRGCRRNANMIVVDFPAGRVGTCRRNLTPA